MMQNSYSGSYASAGVDVTAGYRGVELMKEHVAKTMIPGVLSGIGGFGGLFEIDTEKYKKPVLVSGTDGVGTKLKIAFLMDKHDTVGQDCVAMCVNDIVCAGAAPVCFLDYIALGKNIPEKVAEIVRGVAEGCVMAGCALVGGETAEMPGIYIEDDYDMAGFSVGIVEKDKIIDRSKVKTGDVLVGLYSSGLHSNGFSLVRKVLQPSADNINEYIPELGKTLGEELLTPTIIYVKPVLQLISEIDVHGIANITGGGFYENIPRMLSDGQSAKIDKASLPNNPIFKYIQEKGNIPERDMYNTFNMGIGMVMAMNENDVYRSISVLAGCGIKCCVIGEVTEGNSGVEIV